MDGARERQPQNIPNLCRRERVQPREVRVEDEEPYGASFDEEDDRDFVVGIDTGYQADILAGAQKVDAQTGDGAPPDTLYASHIGARRSDPLVNDNAHSGLQQVPLATLKGIVPIVATKADV
ncbi:hypothetical protein F0562_034140 [Nyssa sinensis]|uniref:Uncharacterized protein n=1 Tax=Nyssa sinensis TaxID=561372 RepID=A0A5J5AGN8_9ASTE|nr:hypothetical protein F0562_034140 [Nyssa sinensis]